MTAGTSRRKSAATRRWLWSIGRTADPTLTARIQEQAEKLRKQFDAEVVVLDNQVEDMSSTETRRMLHFQCADTYLAPRLLEYIQQKGLYGTGENWKNLPFEQLRKISLSLHNPKRVPHVIVLLRDSSPAGPPVGRRRGHCGPLRAFCTM